MINRYLIILLCTLHISFTFGQTPRFDQINISNGLSDNTVLSIDIDSIGNIWFGTSNGLNKFDGNKIHEYKSNLYQGDEIIGNSIIAVHADPLGKIWILTPTGGLNYFDINQNQFHHFYDSTLSSYIPEYKSTICHTNDSMVWIQNIQGISVYNLLSRHYTVIDNRLNIYGIYKISPEAIIYYGDFGIRSVRIIDDKLQINQESNEPIQQLVQTNEGYITATSTLILHLNKNLSVTDTLLVIDKPIRPGYPLTSLAVSDKYLWIGFEYGLHRLPLKKNLVRGGYSADGPVSISYINEHITNLIFDKAGNLWIGTTEKGVYLHSKIRNLFQFTNWNFNSIHNTETEYRINSDPVSAICRTQNGELWLGSSKNGVGIIKPDGTRRLIKQYYDSKGTPLDLILVRCIIEDSQNTIWLATPKGILYYNRNKNRIETINQKYKWSWPYFSATIKEFIPGHVTITGGNLIGEVNLKTGYLNVLPAHMNGVYLWSFSRDMALDQQKSLWIVQNNRGLIKIDSARTAYTLYLKENAGFTDNKIYSLTIDGDSIWLATGSGLNLFSIKNGRVIKTYSKKDGLSSDIIYGLNKDSANNLWMSTSKGISKLNLNDNSISSYLLNTYFFNHAYFTDNNNTIFYGGYNTVVQFQPKLIQNVSIKPNPLITDFWLFNTNIHVGDTINNKILLKQRLSQLSEIVLSHKQNSFSLGFNAYPFNYPNNTYFKYRLKGVQAEWVFSPTNTRIASYTGLQPGKYKFQVSASVLANIWSKPIELDIIVTPPFWQQLWFYICSIILITLIIISYIRLRISAIKHRSIILEQRVDEQTRELKEQNQQIKTISEKLHEADQSKLRFFTNISHEFRTPLTLILGHLSNPDKNSLERSSSVIKKNALRLLNLVNQLIDIRKLDQDQLKLNISQFDIISFTSNIIDSFQELVKRKNISLQYYSEQNELNVWLDTDKMEKILYNLISNAIKYTPAEKNIVVEIKSNKNDIILIIQDDGIGIARKDLDKIFERFYRSDNNTAEGHGIGLSLAKNLTEIQQGTITVSSEINNGTCFTLCFKKGKKHFKPENFGKTESNGYSVLEPYTSPPTPINKSLDYKILIVEDNIELRDYISNLLNQDFLIQTADNGRDAIDLLSNFMPDLIISDMMMPIMDGIQFCSQVKDNLETCHIPFVILTAKTDSETKIEGFTTGIDAFIEKPFDPIFLLARINALLTNRGKIKKFMASSPNLHEGVEKVIISKSDKEFWKKVNQKITENYHNAEFNAEILSEAMHVSRTTFYRKFKNLTGLNAADHIRKFRLYKASELLLENELDVVQVSESVGFKSLSQFRINFKQEFGKTPSEYQKGK